MQLGSVTLEEEWEIFLDEVNIFFNWSQNLLSPRFKYSLMYELVGDPLSSHSFCLNFKPGALRRLGRADAVQDRLNVSIFQLIQYHETIIYSVKRISPVPTHQVFCPVKMIHCLVPCSNMNCNSDCAVQGIFHR